MRRERVELALERLSPSAWKLFEETAPEFLTDEFPTLQPTAAQEGDLGRDAELWQPRDDPSVLVQFSVARDWDAKIRHTVKRIKENFPNAYVLVYATNHAIGPVADALIEKMRRKNGIVVSVRDRNWFLDRLHRSAATEAAGNASRYESLIRSSQAAESSAPKAQALDSHEARAALVYLNLQVEDDIPGEEPHEGRIRRARPRRAGRRRVHSGTIRGG